MMMVSTVMGLFQTSSYRFTDGLTSLLGQTLSTCGESHGTTGKSGSGLAPCRPVLFTPAATVGSPDPLLTENH